jgi:hypothetical protein
MAGEASRAVLEALDAIERRLKRMEEKLEEMHEDVNAEADEDDSMPGWLKMALAHPVTQNVFEVLGDKERLRRMVARASGEEPK